MAEDAAGSGRPGSGAPVVLVVDDDQQFLALLVRSLRYEGFTADSAASAAAALDYSAERRPDVIVLVAGGSSRFPSRVISSCPGSKQT
jgi:PleD family two-component response regulator